MWEHVHFTATGGGEKGWTRSGGGADEEYDMLIPPMINYVDQMTVLALHAIIGHSGSGGEGGSGDFSGSEGHARNGGGGGGGGGAGGDRGDARDGGSCSSGSKGGGGGGSEGVVIIASESLGAGVHMEAKGGAGGNGGNGNATNGSGGGGGASRVVILIEDQSVTPTVTSRCGGTGGPTSTPFTVRHRSLLVAALPR